MQISARELNQQTATVLSHVERGETVVITRNGVPVALMRPYAKGDEPLRPYRTDPMGQDDNAPVFTGEPSDLAEGADDYLARGFGR